METATELSEQLAHNHREIEDILVQLEALPQMDGQRKNFVGQLAIELTRHLVAEEEFLHLWLREDAEGTALAQAAATRHHRMLYLFRELEDTTFGSVHFERLLGPLIEEARDHFRQSRTTLPAYLAKHLPQEELTDLDLKLRRVKFAVPVCQSDAQEGRATENVASPLAFGPGSVDQIRAVASSCCKMA